MARRLKLDVPIPHICPGSRCAMCRYQHDKRPWTRSEAAIEMWRKRREDAADKKGETGAVFCG